MMNSVHDSNTFVLPQCGQKNWDGKPGSKGFTVRCALNLARSLFHEVGIETDWLDAQLLLGQVLEKTRLEVQLDGQMVLSKEQSRSFFSLVKRRLCYEPVAYILGVKEFFGLDFIVSKDCLIPRPDTEVIVEKCLSLISKDSSYTIFDLCTGSGAIGLALLSERPSLTAILSDISMAALNIASINAKKHALDHRVTLRHGDLFEPFLPTEKAALIVANPPYIGSQSVKNLPSSVKEYEPNLALDAGDDQGVNFYRRLLALAPNFLCPQGYLVMEIGFDQKEAIEKLIGEPWKEWRFFDDLAGLNRGLVLQKR